MTPSPTLSRVVDRLVAIRPVQAIGAQIHAYDGSSLSLTAPLAQNINDKACAFGGSLGSVMTLAAWALFSVKLEEAGLLADVYVQRSTVDYLAPLYDDLTAEASLAPELEWEEVLAGFRQRGRVRARMAAQVCARDGTPCAILEGRFVALTPRP